MRLARPYREENNGPGKDILGELDPAPGIREQPGSIAADRYALAVRSRRQGSLVLVAAEGGQRTPEASMSQEWTS